MPLREAEHPVKSIVPLPLSTIPGSTLQCEKIELELHSYKMFPNKFSRTNQCSKILFRTRGMRKEGKV